MSLRACWGHPPAAHPPGLPLPPPPRGSPCDPDSPPHELDFPQLHCGGCLQMWSDRGPSPHCVCRWYSLCPCRSIDFSRSKEVAETYIMFEKLNLNKKKFRHFCSYKSYNPFNKIVMNPLLNKWETPNLQLAYTVQILNINEFSLVLCTFTSVIFLWFHLQRPVDCYIELGRIIYTL